MGRARGAAETVPAHRGSPWRGAANSKAWRGLPSAEVGPLGDNLSASVGEDSASGSSVGVVPWGPGGKAPFRVFLEPTPFPSPPFPSLPELRGKHSHFFFFKSQHNIVSLGPASRALALYQAPRSTLHRASRGRHRSPLYVTDG